MTHQANSLDDQRVEQIARDWIDWHITQEDRLLKVHDELREWVFSRPQDAWRVIQRIHRMPVTTPGWHEAVHASLAAGPIEELLSAHGALMIEAVETEAGQHESFRHLLRNCYRHGMSEAVWTRLQAASG